jgi:hypothetical protein
MSLQNSRNHFFTGKALFHSFYPAFLNDGWITKFENFREDEREQVEQKSIHNQNSSRLLSKRYARCKWERGVWSYRILMREYI